MKWKLIRFAGAVAKRRFVIWTISQNSITQGLIVSPLFWLLPHDFWKAQILTGGLHRRGRFQHWGAWNWRVSCRPSVISQNPFLKVTFTTSRCAMHCLIEVAMKALNWRHCGILRTSGNPCGKLQWLSSFGKAIWELGWEIFFLLEGAKL